MGQSWPLFVYFHSFLVTISIQIEKSVDSVLGIRTRGRRMVDTDETTELWRPPIMAAIMLFHVVLSSGASIGRDGGGGYVTNPDASFVKEL